MPRLCFKHIVYSPSGHKKINESQHSVLTCTFVGIYPGRVEPASLIALTTSRTEAHQARRSCASPLETFNQSFFCRAWPKTRGPEIGSRLALIVVAHVCATYEVVWEGEGPSSAHLQEVFWHDQTNGTFFARAVLVCL